jgi:hypothetical protein
VHLEGGELVEPITISFMLQPVWLLGSSVQLLRIAGELFGSNGRFRVTVAKTNLSERVRNCRTLAQSSEGVECTSVLTLFGHLGDGSDWPRSYLVTAQGLYVVSSGAVVAGSFNLS